MKKIFGLVSLLAFVSCGGNNFEVSGLEASKICSGEIVGDTTGTAACTGSAASSGVTGGFYVLASRNDLSSVDMTDPAVLLDIVSGTVNRSNSVATLQAVYSANDFLNFFKSKYQAVPNPVTDSDGWSNDSSEGVAKKHYLETIVGRPNQVCGTSGTISQRITHCEVENGTKSFYNGRQYGQHGEGDWKLVTRLTTGEEVWRDERTKLIWSDRSLVITNWYRAAGYAKITATSQNETGYDAQPGSGVSECTDIASLNEDCQPAQPISICAEVDANGEIIAGGADPLYDGSYAPNATADFKGHLSISQNVIWKLPSIYDFKLADVNGIRKVLPNMNENVWTSTSSSMARNLVWLFGSNTGEAYISERNLGLYNEVRCVGFARD